MAEGSSVFSVNFDSSRKKEASFSIKTLRTLLKDLSAYKFSILLIFLFSVGSAYTFVMIPEYLGEVIDLFVSAFISSIIKGKSDVGSSEIADVIIPTVAVFLINALLALCRDITAGNLSSKYADSKRNSLFDKMLTVEMSYIDVHSKKSVYEVATGVTDLMNQSINLIISQELSAVFCVIAVIIKLFTLNTAFGIFSLLVIPLSFLLNSIAVQIKDVSEKAQQVYPIPDFREIYGHFSSVRLSGEREEIIRAFEKNEDIRAKSLYRARFFDAITKNPSSFLCSAALVICVGIGASAVNEGTLTLGTVISVVIFFLKYSTPLSQISTFSSSVSNLFYSAGIVFGFLGEEDEIRGNNKLSDQKTEKGITFESVTFRYKGSKEDVLQDASFSIRERGITVLKGETGIGKTTVLKLMTGFYVPDKGRITYNGEDINTFDIKAFRERFSLIEQEAGLFECSLKDNIIYPDSVCDEERLKKVLELIGADSVTEGLAEGYDTIFRLNPQNLSDGQIQLILLGRAIYHEKEFIILDEALSYMDTELEAHIYPILKKLSQDHGIIIISHRKTHIPTADAVIRIC